MMKSQKFFQMLLVASFLFIMDQTAIAFVVSPLKTHTKRLNPSSTKVSLILPSETSNDFLTTTSSVSSFQILLSDTTTSSWLANTDVWVFIAGIIPFAWATVQFWTRIATGQPFGTGEDFIYIGKDNVPEESRGQRTLDRGAFLVAYVLFGIAAAAIGITLYSVITSPPLPPSIS